jgi:6-phosphogluconolactonase (cycloisomerase 2 family)
LALGSNFDFPVQVFEDRNNMWHQVGNLDIATTSQVQHVAISGDGRNIVVGEHLTEQIVARLFRRSGSRFVQMQDISFEGVFFRGMCLDVGGERLVVAVDDTVTTYRKDCSTGN